MMVDVLRKRIMVARKELPADVVIRGGKIVNVFTGELMVGDVAVVDGVFAGIGSYDGREVIDATGKFIVPGFIDGHVHIESSMLTPSEFAKVVLGHGVTSVVTDPHEIANVAGERGIEFMLADADGLPLDVYVMLPSSVPATEFESSGAKLGARELMPFMKDERVLGLAEVMDFPALARGDEDMLEKIVMAHRNGAVVDGHAAGIGRDDLNVYMAAGIRSEHESIDAAEAKDRLDMGMYLMIREGTVAKDLEALLPVITPENARRCLFVTDDKLLDDLVHEGSVDHCVRLAIEKGLDPITAIQMVTLNSAECFRLKHVGAIAAGYDADFLILNDLESVSIDHVFKKGKCVVANDEIVSGVFSKSEQAKLPQINVKDFSLGRLELPLQSDYCHVIEVIPNKIVTKHLKEKVDLVDGKFVPSIVKDQLKMAVVERHHGTGNVGLGIVKGFGLKQGAIATTVAHDSHNIVVVGTSDEEMALAVEHIISTNGGLAVVSGGEVIGSLSLPIAGLLSDRPYEEVLDDLLTLNVSLNVLGSAKTFNPFLMLSFLTLPVIPSLKLTDKGLFDFESFGHITVEVE